MIKKRKKRGLSTYLANPTKYFYPMNMTPANSTFITLKTKKSFEKIPEFLKDIISTPPVKPKGTSLIKLKSTQTTQKKPKNFNYYNPSVFRTPKVKDIKISRSQERILYNPTVIMINPRSKMTLYTLNDYQNRSARILSRFGKKNDKIFQKIKI